MQKFIQQPLNINSLTMDNTCNLKWLEWAKELQFLAQAGLTYTKDDFDKERFERIRSWLKPD